MSPSVATRIRLTAAGPELARLRVRMRDWRTFPAILSFSAGLLTNMRFQFGGKASLGEAVLAVIAIFAVLANLGNRRFWNRRMLLVLCALGTSFCGYVISDLINSTPPERLLRGWARMAFVTADFVAVWALSRTSMVNLFAICIGDALSSVLSYGAENGNFLYNYKFHIAMPLTVLLMLTIPLLVRRNGARATGMAMIGAGMMHLWLDFRMAGAICIVVGFILVARCITASRFRKLYVTLLLLALVSSSVAIGLVISATNGVFGDRREGSNSERLSLALAGLNAIERSPVFGLGSWAWDFEMNSVYASYQKHIDANDLITGETRAPHSQVIQVWAEAGLLGLVFILVYGKLLAHALWLLIFKRPLDVLSPLFLYYLLLATWDLFFSPFANLHRFLIGLAVVICVQVLRERESAVRFANRVHHRILAVPAGGRCAATY